MKKISLIIAMGLFGMISHGAFAGNVSEGTNITDFLQAADSETPAPITASEPVASPAK